MSRIYLFVNVNYINIWLLKVLLTKNPPISVCLPSSSTCIFDFVKIFLANNNDGSFETKYVSLILSKIFL